MSKDRTWRIAEEALYTLKADFEDTSKLSSDMMIAPESPLFETRYKLQNKMIEVIEELVGDELESVNWFVYENQFGASGLEAGDEDMRPIKTIGDLKWLVEVSNEQ